MIAPIAIARESVYCVDGVGASIESIASARAAVGEVLDEIRDHAGGMTQVSVEILEDIIR